MKYECAKCDASDDNHIMVVEGGISYLFCKACYEIVESLPTNSIRSFVGPKEETWVSRNIRVAKERRACGESLWLNV